MKSVMNYKKPVFGMIVLAVTACVAVAVCFLTNPLGFRFDEANSAYTDFLSGNRTILADGQSETWWIPDFQEDGMKYEFTYLDLNGDGPAELIVQMADAPYGYNGVFHFEKGKIFCWNSDAAEMTCWDVPLDNGTMVRQYDTSGSHIYTVFRYTDSGEQEELHHLFFREQLVPEDSTEPCPYYEIDGTEMEEAEFNERLNELVTVHRMASSAWTMM